MTPEQEDVIGTLGLIREELAALAEAAEHIANILERVVGSVPAIPVRQHGAWIVREDRP